MSTKATTLKYLIVIEREREGYSAFFPDLPGCYTEGESIPELLRNAEDAVRTHLEGLKQEGLPIPEPRSEARSVEVAAS